MSIAIADVTMMAIVYDYITELTSKYRTTKYFTTLNRIKNALLNQIRLKSTIKIIDYFMVFKVIFRHDFFCQISSNINENEKLKLKWQHYYIAHQAFVCPCLTRVPSKPPSNNQTKVVSFLSSKIA